MSNLRRLIQDFASQKWDNAFLLALLLFECVLNAAIVKYVPYTEIDWDAYMSEVSMYQSGERDYLNIRGGTGPLVYPAGFLYLYEFFKYLAGGNGSNIFMAQVIFIGLYIINAGLVLSIYTIALRSIYGGGQCQSFKDAIDIWTFRLAMIATCLSKRIHSIFVLRLFNDAPAMLLFYGSTLLFANSKMKWGCCFFSLAVSIKMNILLFAPGLLLLLLQTSRSLIDTIVCLGICASIQLILGAPFLSTYPISYIRKAFELDRVFFYKWTVNWKFLPENVFVSKHLSILLLLCHVGTLCFMCSKWIRSVRHEHISGRAVFQGEKLSPEYTTYTLFVSNFIGIVFSRTLHYQFYSWYFHTVPFMLLFTELPVILKLILIGMIEYAFNIFPATSFSSCVLQCSHLVILLALWKSEVPALRSKAKPKKA